MSKKSDVFGLLSISISLNMFLAQMEPHMWEPLMRCGTEKLTDVRQTCFISLNVSHLLGHLKKKMSEKKLRENNKKNKASDKTYIY